MNGIGPDVTVVGRTGGVSESRYGRPRNERRCLPSSVQTGGQSWQLDAHARFACTTTFLVLDRPIGAILRPARIKAPRQIDFYSGIARSRASNPRIERRCQSRNFCCDGYSICGHLSKFDSVLSKWSEWYNSAVKRERRVGWQCNSKKNSVNRLQRCLTNLKLVIVDESLPWEWSILARVAGDRDKSAEHRLSKTDVIEIDQSSDDCWTNWTLIEVIAHNTPFIRHNCDLELRRVC